MLVASKYLANWLKLCLKLRLVRFLFIKISGDGRIADTLQFFPSQITCASTYVVVREQICLLEGAPKRSRTKVRAVQVELLLR